MDEDQKKDVAIFRFGVISDFVSGVHLERGEQEQFLREKCRPEMVHSSFIQNTTYQKYHFTLDQALQRQ